MIKSIIFFSFLFVSKSILGAHGCAVPGCNNFYDTMMSAPGQGPCQKCTQIGLKKCPGRPTDLSEAQWTLYFQKFALRILNLSWEEVEFAV